VSHAVGEEQREVRRVLGVSHIPRVAGEVAAAGRSQHPVLLEHNDLHRTMAEVEARARATGRTEKPVAGSARSSPTMHRMPVMPGQTTLQGHRWAPSDAGTLSARGFTKAPRGRPEGPDPKGGTEFHVVAEQACKPPEGSAEPCGRGVVIEPYRRRLRDRRSRFDDGRF
jgi:hypothetical protein